jgi:hypothetical protein
MTRLFLVHVLLTTAGPIPLAGSQHFSADHLTSIEHDLDSPEDKREPFAAVLSSVNFRASVDLLTRGAGILKIS